jgi:hypothetical protein
MQDDETPGQEFQFRFTYTELQLLQRAFDQLQEKTYTYVFTCAELQAVHVAMGRMLASDDSGACKALATKLGMKQGHQTTKHQDKQD